MDSQGWSLWQTWLDAWNRHDLEAVLAHYADDVVFVSGAVIALAVNDSGTVEGKTAVRRVFEAGLREYEDLRFTPLYAFSGVGEHALHYLGIGGRHVIEVHSLDAVGKIVAARAYHGPAHAP